MPPQRYDIGADSDIVTELELAGGVAKAAEGEAKPISDKRGTKEFRIEVAGVLARRAAKIAYDRAKGLTK